MQQYRKFFTLAAAPSERVCAAYVVSKRVALRAVVRNRLKRRCRAVLRGASRLPRASLVFVAKRGAADASFSEVRADILLLLGHVLRDVSSAPNTGGRDYAK